MICTKPLLRQYKEKWPFNEGFGSKMEIFVVSIFLIVRTVSGTDTLKQGTFYMLPKTYLKGVPIQEILVTRRQNCAFYCLQTKSCFSYNIEISSENKISYLCELLREKSPFTGVEKLLPSENFDYVTIQNSCTKEPCLHGGTCVDDYSAPEGFSCVCSQDYTGTLCHTEKRYFDVHLPNPDNVNDYVILHKNSLPALQELTICLWVKTSEEKCCRTMVSYATSTEDDELIVYDYTNLHIYIKGATRTTGISLNNEKWNHICVTWNGKNGSWRVLKNGTKVVNGTDFQKGRCVDGGGTFVLGQDQDHVGGGFYSKESMMGYISQVNVWDKVIPDEEVQKMARSCKYLIMEGNVVKWSEFETGAHGDAKIVTPSKCSPNHP